MPVARIKALWGTASAATDSPATSPPMNLASVSFVLQPDTELHFDYERKPWGWPETIRGGSRVTGVSRRIQRRRRQHPFIANCYSAPPNREFDWAVLGTGCGQKGQFPGFGTSIRGVAPGGTSK
jgi:hypothetical protein